MGHGCLSENSPHRLTHLDTSEQDQVSAVSKGPHHSVNSNCLVVVAISAAAPDPAHDHDGHGLTHLLQAQ